VDPDDLEMLEDLILAAISQAQGKARAQLEAEMRQATGGMPMPDLGSLLGG
jgi:DNA-binding protein YbaB